MLSSSSGMVKLANTEMESKMIVKRRKIKRGRRKCRYLNQRAARASPLTRKPTKPNTESSTSSIIRSLPED